MKRIILIKTIIGYFMGFHDGSLITGLHNPVEVEYLTVPAQGNLGQRGVASITHMRPWPSEKVELHIYKKDPHALSFFDADLDADLPIIKQYFNTIKDAWKTEPDRKSN